MHPVTPVAVTLFMLDSILWLDSQAITDCGTRWFGPKCQYMCRCADDICDNYGRCMDEFRCQNGWFGPACQYVDLAYKQSAVPEITDGDDDTCLDAKTLKGVNITCSYVISWFRVHFKQADDAPVSTLTRMRYDLKVGKGIIPCPDPSYAFVDNWTMEIQCSSDQFVEELILTDLLAHKLCTVHISGGRNVALRQHVSQSSNYSEQSIDTAYKRWFFPAKLAVDGNTNQNLIRGGSCSQTANTTDYQFTAYWTLTMDLPVVVNRYVIYVREDATPFKDSMMGFRLESYSDSGDLVFSYQDTSGVAQSVYLVSHADLVVSMVKITSTSDDNIVHICEFEMYGDTLCPAGKYGTECENTCRCAAAEKCLTTTGHCATHCPIGYTGMDCNTTCAAGFYGRNCQQKCSHNCRDQGTNTLCDHVTGECLYGCTNGYEPPACITICDQGWYGDSCTDTCSPHCFSPSNGTEICNRLDGTCLYGCSRGYLEARCNTSCGIGKFGKACTFLCSEGCAASNDSAISRCHHVTGNCRFGCIRDYNGTACNDMLVSLLESRKNQFLSLRSFMIVGCTVVGCVALAIISMILFCLKKRTQGEQEELGEG